jgi:CRP/FNR family transcriptional regulator
MATKAPDGRTTEDTAALLERVPLFVGLSVPELSKIAALAVLRHYPGGTAILHEGDPGDTCYVVRSGRARVTRQHPDGRTITLTNIGPGEIFGELAMFGGEVRSATVEAIEDMEALAILAGDLKRLLKEHPEIAIKLLSALGARLREANERIAGQSFQNVSSRVAGVLAKLIATESGTSAAQLDGKPSSEIIVHSTQADLAKLAGASREATSRFLASLQRAGILTCRRGRVVVHDPQALHRYIY